MRLAFVSPLPPAPTGIADYTIDVVDALRDSHSIELFHDQADVAGVAGIPAYRVDELQKRPQASRYDAVVYQMGNAPAHDFMYDWMERAPGLVVLHDLVLHHAYARRFLESPQSRAYAADPSSRDKKVAAETQHARYLAAIESIYPGQGDRLKDAQFNTSGDLLPYAYPLFQPALTHARAVGAHNAFMVDAISEARSDLSVVELAMPVTPIAVQDGSVAALRQRLGFATDDIVIGCFGLVTREKRIETVARAVKRVAVLHPSVRLLLAGPVADAAWVDSVLDRAGVASRTVVTGRLDNADFAAAMDLSAIVVHLRYPTARETSAALLRVLAQGRPSVISDIANQSGIPDRAVLRVDMTDEEGGLARAIDGLIRNPEAARVLGAQARAFALERHSKARTLESYDRLLKSVRPHYSHASP